MAKRIWFKPDCVRWIREGKKTTTFRKRRHEGVYEVVRGSWFKAKPIGLRVRLTPLCQAYLGNVLDLRFDTEGDFGNTDEFIDWLVEIGLTNKVPDFGWLHKVEIVGKEAPR